jgi:hypothetical protein
MLKSYQFQTLIGISESNFWKLFETLQNNSKLSQLKNVFSPPMQLIVTLLWLRQGISFLFLAWVFGVSVSSISRYVGNAVEWLYETMVDLIYIPRSNERYLTNRQYRGKSIAMIVDGVEQPMYAPRNRQLSKVTFSSKKKMHTLTKLIGIAPNGKIWYLSPSYYGSISDSNLASMPENRISDNLESNEYIMADLGFKGLNVYGIITHQETKSQIYQRRFKSMRVTVENSIREVKRWKICKLIFKARIGKMRSIEFLHYHHKIWMVCSGLANMFQLPRKK